VHEWLEVIWGGEDGWMGGVRDALRCLKVFELVRVLDRCAWLLPWLCITILSTDIDCNLGKLRSLATHTLSLSLSLFLSLNASFEKSSSMLEGSSCSMMSFAMTAYLTFMTLNHDEQGSTTV